ncbi:MAG: rRNA methyltransferase [Spirochaetaceae bacterium]|jgi:ribosomal protein RSM22 (predicted rRNA methylase)|nr:rRNA methyltransferase [Spirochaetaceae bacterium]
MNLLFPPLTAGLSNDLERLLSLIDKTFPLKQRFLAELPKNIGRLSALLTRERSSLNGAYMSDPVLLNAYLRYFLPWNVFRLSRLLPALHLNGVLSAAGGVEIVDIGSGPLTFPVSLWIALPELRAVPLRFLCIDQNSAALDAGKKLFSAIAAENTWQIKTRRAALGERFTFAPAALFSAVNVCNELIQNMPQSDMEALNKTAKRLAHLFSNSTNGAGRVLLIEPGAPRPAQFLYFMRKALIEQGFAPEAPCPAPEECPMRSGRRGQKWCHFSIDTDDAPAELQKLSAKALLPKEKVTLSFLLAAKGLQRKVEKDLLNVRVISGAFSLPDSKTGRYACSEKGLTLLRGGKGLIEKYKEGVFFQAEAPYKSIRDAKSGALILNVEDAPADV